MFSNTKFKMSEFIKFLKILNIEYIKPSVEVSDLLLFNSKLRPLKKLKKKK